MCNNKLTASTCFPLPSPRGRRARMQAGSKFHWMGSIFLKKRKNIYKVRASAAPMTQCSGEPRAGLELEVVHLQHLYLPDISDQISDFFGLSRTPTVRRSDLRRTNTPSLTCPCGFDRAAAQPELVYSPQLITRPCGCSSARLMPPERTGGEHMELVMILF